MTEGVKNFLHSLGMGKYYNIFSAKGFDLETDIPHLTLTDLKETLMVSCHEEREIILYSAKRFKAGTEHYVYEWLRRHSLDHYFVSFLQSGLVSLETVSDIQLPNEDLYDELEIMLPGHRKRLERAVTSLRQEMQRQSVAEKPVTQGWWGKPGCLPQAKFDFLCVEGTLFAGHEPDKRVKIDFMVDSGSDVSTVQEKTLESLNLELVGPVYSCGIHGGNHTNLYRAQLQIGSQQMTVEVIASNYDSLGSRIVRHFRHVIDGNRHIWLKGNYKDPVPAVLPLKVPNTMKHTNSVPQVLSIEHERNSTNSLSAASIPNHHTLKTSSTQETNEKPTKPLVNNSDVSKTFPKTGNDSVDATKDFISNSCATKSVNNQDQALNPNIHGGIRPKRTLEHSEDECDQNDEASQIKCIKLDQGVDSSPRSHEYLLSRSSSSVGSFLPSSHQHISSISRASNSQLTHSDIRSSSAPYHPSLHRVRDTASSSPHQSPLRDTDDDIDHINSEAIYSNYLTSSQPSFSNHSHTNHVQNLPVLSSEEFSIQPKATVSDMKSNKQTMSQNDVIHICSDDDENDNCVDAIHEDTVHIEDNHESNIRSKKFSRNFIPVNNSSSVMMISMLELDGDSVE